MTRGPHVIPEGVLMEFVAVVVVATTVVALVAYVGTWIAAQASARRRRRGARRARARSHVRREHA
ncbi:MAG TPA: hypothetical protein VD704_01135 [Gaiellaceae bacterium]|nr:hypothetical protein [Gaiellaceae bacterium]